MGQSGDASGGVELVIAGEELTVSTSLTDTEERLCALAGGDLHALDVAAKLDRDTQQLVQIAALVALDAPRVSWVVQLDAADEAKLDLEQVLGTLVALAPIVGTLRVVSAGAKIARATGLAVS